MKLFFSLALIFGFSNLYSLQEYNIEESIIIEENQYTKTIQTNFNKGLSISLTTESGWEISEEMSESTLILNNYDSSSEFFITPMGENIESERKFKFINTFLSQHDNVSPSDIKNEMLDVEKSFFYFYANKSLCKNDRFKSSIVGLIDVKGFTFVYLACVNNYDDFDNLLSSVESINIS